MPPTKTPSARPRLTFRRFGRTHHLEIRGPQDLRGILELDEALWVATSAPVSSFNCDPVFLELLDCDTDGRIRTYEVRQAIRWLLEHLDDRQEIAPGDVSLALDAIDTETDEGRSIRSSAQKILRSLEAPDSSHIDLDQVREVRRMEEGRAVSEAGVVLPAAASDERVSRFLGEILDTVGGEPHPSGQPGVGKETLEKFLAEAEAYVRWRTVAETSAEAVPLGEATAEAWELYSQLRDKIDQYFALDRAVRFDSRFEKRAVPQDVDLAQADISDAAAVDDFLVSMPLVAPSGSGELELEGRINPLYREKLSALRTEVLRPLLGGGCQRLAAEQWDEVRRVLAPHGAWLAEKPETRVGELGLERLRQLAADPYEADALKALVRESETTALVLANVRLVEKLILFKAELLTFVNSYVSFPNLYDPKSRALFEAGSLVMDGRHFNLAVKVPDRKKHSQVSVKGNMFVLYVKISSKERPEPVEVALPVTSGGRGNLYVGKRGVFFHIGGYQLDAEVVDIVENPISFSEAVLAPFKRLGRALTGKIEKLTSAAEEKLDASSTETFAGLRDALKKDPAAAASAQPAVGNVLAGGGIALAALGSSAAFVAKTLAGLNWVEILGGLGAAGLSVLLPVSVVALLKLRQRDLSTLLEGSGWGINARMRLSRSQIRYFTHGPSYPQGARGVRHRRLPWWGWALLAAALISVAWYLRI